MSDDFLHKYSDLYNLAPSAYFTLTDEGKIIELNHSGTLMLGKEKNELLGGSFGFFVSDDTKPIFSKFLNRILIGNSKETCEVSLVLEDKRIINVYLAGIISENGVQCVLNAVDISELRKVEQTLRESEEHNRAIILETAMDGFWLSDLKGNLLEVNKTYCRMAGYTEQELLSMHISDLEVVEIIEETDAHLKKIILQGEDRFETQHRRKDGSLFDVEVSVQYQPINGGRFVSFLHDISERKMAERYREMTRDILQILNEPGDILELVKRVLTLMKTGTGFDAVGIRLQEGDDFPFFAHKGFSRDFILAENTLVERSNDGEVCRDKNGNVRLECTCGMVISGRNKRNSQLLTPGGSFWTNDSSLLLNIPEEIDAMYGPRNRCVNQGYASMAFVPVRNKDKIVGLLQFSHKTKDRFTLIVVEKLEGIASHIGAAIMRKHAEETVRESEKRRLAILDTAMDGFWLFDNQGCLLEVNETYCRMSGYSTDELRSMHIKDLDATEKQDGIVAHIQKIISKGEDRFESRHRRKDGSTFDVEVSVQYQEDEGGQFVTFLHDITERKIAEEALNKLNEELEDRVKQRTFELQKLNSALQKAEEKYRTVADFTYRWEFWIGENDEMLYCSPSCERITGYKTSEFIQNPRLIYNIIHPKDLNIFLNHKQKEKNAKNASREIKFRIIKFDGSIRWIGHICQPVYNDMGVFIGTRGSNNDITDRKEIEKQLKTSNQKYQLLSANISDGIFMCQNGTFEYVNKSLNLLFGYNDHELEGVKLMQLIVPEHRDEVDAFLSISYPSDQYRNIEIECRKKDQSTIFVELFLNYVAKQGVIYGVVHDITEKKQIQKNIFKAIIQTEENEKANFSKELHDGLGPILSTIKLYLQWSERPKSNKSRQEIIRKAEDILEEALSTVKEISNKLSPHLLTYYGLTSAIQSFVDKLEETSTFEIDFQSNLNRRLDMEVEAAIYRATIECINNSMKYANAKNITIILHDTGDQLKLHYKDDGVGFNLEKVLITKRGLGLFNLQNRIETIGGKITMFSETGHGVDYQIYINF